MQSRTNLPTAPASGVTPPVAFLRTGRVPADAPHFVQFVEEDASGDLRLVEDAPESPRSAPYAVMCAGNVCRRSA